jgi:hypothetical protein
MFEFGEDLLDRVEVGAVGWQEEQMRSRGPDGVADRLALVAAECPSSDNLRLVRRYAKGGSLAHPG